MSYTFDYKNYGPFQFVTMDEYNKIGSIYYKNGRIRLVHREGPGIGACDTNIFRCTLPQNIAKELDGGLHSKQLNKKISFLNKRYNLDYKSDTQPEDMFESIKEKISGEKGYSDICHDSKENCVLFELSSKLGSHISRGRVVHEPLINYYDPIISFDDPIIQNKIIECIKIGLNTLSKIDPIDFYKILKINESNNEIYKYFQELKKSNHINLPNKYWKLAKDESSNNYMFIDESSKSPKQTFHAPADFKKELGEDEIISV